MRDPPTISRQTRYDTDGRCREITSSELSLSHAQHDFLNTIWYRNFWGQRDPWESTETAQQDFRTPASLLCHLYKLFRETNVRLGRNIPLTAMFGKGTNGVSELRIFLPPEGFLLPPLTEDLIKMISTKEALGSDT